jgi:hypothetical protein
MLPTRTRCPAAAATLPWRRAGAIFAALVTCACHGDPPPVAPGEPIPPAPEVALGTMDAECDGLIAALATYKACPNLDDDDRWDIDAWTDRAQQDFTAGKKAKPEPNAQRAIAAACHKAIASVTAANERCHAGPKPPR